MDGVRIPSDKDAGSNPRVAQSEESLYFETAKQSPALYDLGRLMMNQGCRPEEVLELQISDIDLERSRLTIRGGKSRAARRHLRLTSRRVAETSRRDGCRTSKWLFAGKTPDHA